MGAEARAVVAAADEAGDRFVAMQGLAAVSYSANFLGAFAAAEAALRRAATIAREDDKAYRLTIVLEGSHWAAIQGRSAETPSLFEEAKAANPAFRDSVLVEVEALVRFLAGDYTGRSPRHRRQSPGCRRARRGAAPRPGVRRHVSGRVGNESEAERLLNRARAMLDGADWSFYLATVDWGQKRS